MDKKYNAIKTLKQLDLSRGSRTSLSSGSGKSTFSTQSKEDRYNEAFNNDFESSPKKEEAGMNIMSVKLPPLKPKKLPPLESKIMNPLTGKEVSLTYYKSLVKSGKISDTPSSQPKIEDAKDIDFFSLPEPISFPKKQQGYNIKDPADLSKNWYLMLNKNTPTDPKYKKKQLKLQEEDFDEGAYVANEVIGDPYGKYDDPIRLLKAKPLIDERLRRWVGRKDPNIPAKYSGIGQTTAGYNQDYFDSSSSSAKNKSSSPPKSATPPKKRGRPKGALNKPKNKSSS